MVAAPFRVKLVGIPGYGNKVLTTAVVFTCTYSRFRAGARQVVPAFAQVMVAAFVQHRFTRAELPINIQPVSTFIFWPLYVVSLSFLTASTCSLMALQAEVDPLAQLLQDPGNASELRRSGVLRPSLDLSP